MSQPLRDRYSDAEERANGITHGLGALLAAAGLGGTRRRGGPARHRGARRLLARLRPLAAQPLRFLNALPHDPQPRGQAHPAPVRSRGDLPADRRHLHALHPRDAARSLGVVDFRGRLGPGDHRPVLRGRAASALGRLCRWGCTSSWAGWPWQRSSRSSGRCTAAGSCCSSPGDWPTRWDDFLRQRAASRSTTPGGTWPYSPAAPCTISRCCSTSYPGVEHPARPLTPRCVAFCAVFAILAG